MTHVPMEYWIPGSAILTVVTAGVLDLLLVVEMPGYSLGLILAFWLVAWAYSPLPQGPPNPKARQRKRVWGFGVETEDGPQKEVPE